MNQYSFASDTRDENYTPQWYMSNCVRGVKYEFKNAKAVGLSSVDTYRGILMTILPWADTSGGLPTQIFFLNVNGVDAGKGIFRRYATSATAWSSWTSIDRYTDNVARAGATNTYSGTYYTTNSIYYRIHKGVCYVDADVTCNTACGTLVKIADGLPATPVGVNHCFPVNAHVSASVAGLSFTKGNDGNLWCAFGQAGYRYVASFCYIIA